MSYIKTASRNVCIFGSGNFGSCLADHLADASHQVLMWSRSASVVKAMNSLHTHPKCHKDHVFPDSVRAVGPDFPMRDTLMNMDVFVFAVPTEGLRCTLQDLKSHLPKYIFEHSAPVPSSSNANLRDPLFIFVNKGIESKTNALTLEIIADTLGREIACVASFVSGPSFASEIVRRQPTTVSVSSLSKAHATRTSELLHQPWFRCYTGTDPIGVELAGALKNVYAIAAGIAEGLGYENNTRAGKYTLTLTRPFHKGLITRALAEMTRIGTAYGAAPLTFLTLAGVGDLFLTCSSKNSRNFTVGYRLGCGESLPEILASLGSVAEGVATAKGAKAIIDKLGITAPIAMGVYGVLYDGVSAGDQARWLMEHPAVAELDLPCDVGSAARELLAKLGL
ncbi:NAD-dependent glycerol-3-phosphate dehydrogenase [Hysterangium stoloniferum]|nr:NAD-dependent glycerol-3-phosphate dehydrogenase [Hysterangium stoloniferum]